MLQNIEKNFIDAKGLKLLTRTKWPRLTEIALSQNQEIRDGLSKSLTCCNYYYLGELRVT